MHGITIFYEFSGDEAQWRRTVGEFIDAVNADEEIRGKFHYRVHSAKEGGRKVHWGWWDKPETVQKMQSRDYFRTFSTALKQLAGDGLTAIPVAMERETG